MKQEDIEKFIESSNAVSEQLNRDIRETRMKKDQLEAELKKQDELLDNFLDAKRYQTHFIGKINSTVAFGKIKSFNGEEGQEIYYIPVEDH